MLRSRVCSGHMVVRLVMMVPSSQSFQWKMPLSSATVARLGRISGITMLA